MSESESTSSVASAAVPPPDQRDVEGHQGIFVADVDDGKAENEFGSAPAASTKIWKLYESAADKHDTELAGTWRGQTDAMLIFTGLFSAVVSAFIIETYKMLLPDNSGTTVVLLTQLVAQSQPNGGTSSIPSAGPAQAAFKPSAIAIRINILMFLSFFLSLTCALMSTLIQQWAREYLQYSQLSAPPQKRARVRAYLFQGLTKFQMRTMVESIPVLLHISVFLFFFALSEFLRTVDHTVGLTALYCVIVLLSAYLILSVLPLVVSSAPYQTALTTPLRPCAVFLRFVFKLPVWAVKGGAPTISFRSFLAAALQHNRSRDLLADTERRAANLDYLALQWLLEDVDEDNMDKFVVGLPALVHSPLITDAKGTVEALVADGLLERVEEHLGSSMLSRELSQAASIRRAFACLEALDAIFSVLDQWFDNPRCIRVTNAVIKSSDVLRTRQDSAVALRAACIRAMTFRKLISSLSAPATVHSRLPPHLLALALRLHTWLCAKTRLWGNRAHLEDVEKQVGPDMYDAHSTIMFDGHLINFLVLIRDVLSYAERSTLDLAQLWETLDTMVGTFSITQPTVSASARSRFEEVYADVHDCLYVHDKVGTREGPNKISLMPVSSSLDYPEVLGVGGLTSYSSALRVPSKPHKVGTTVQRSLPTHAAERYRRILEFMDRVDKGSRLAAILYVDLNQSQPSAPELFSFTDDLHLRHDEVYSTDPFDNLDVLRAFLSALPTFNSPTRREKARDTVGKMITADGLFSNISEHLDTCRDEDMPEETRESTSMICLEILEQVFMLFEGSRTVRWYEFGVDAVLNAVNNVAFSQEMVGNTSGMHAYCVLGIMLDVILGQYRSRGVDDHPPAVQNPEEQLFVLMVYDWLCLGNQPERERREGRPEGDPETSREAASPRYLRSLLTSGPLQNFSILPFHMVPHLKEREDIPDIVWATLGKLMDVPGLADADDEVALHYFGVVRKSVRMSVVEEEGDPSQEQLDLLGLVNTVAESLSLPELPMPDLVITPDTPPGGNTPPDRSGYAPVYI